MYNEIVGKQFRFAVCVLFKMCAISCITDGNDSSTARMTARLPAARAWLQPQSLYLSQRWQFGGGFMK